MGKLSSLTGFKMNGLIVLAAVASAVSGQVYAPGLAVPAPAPSHQFHAQDEFGQFSFGYAGGPSAKTEARNAYGVTTGSYQYVDANGILQTVNYISDDINGFRVQGTNLPVNGLAAPVFEGVQAPAPVFEGVQAAQIADTQEVIDAKAAFAEAYAAQEAAVAAVAEEPAAERKRRSAQVLPVAAGLPLTYGGYHGLLAPLAVGAPADIVATINHATPEVVAPAVTYAGIAAPAAAIAPVAAAAPSREAVLTTVKLNPGHAVSYRVD